MCIILYIYIYIYIIIYIYIYEIYIVHIWNFMNEGVYISEMYLSKTCDLITCALRYRYTWAEEPLRLDKNRAEKGEFVPHTSDMYIPESLMPHKKHTDTNISEISVLKVPQNVCIYIWSRPNSKQPAAAPYTQRHIIYGRGPLYATTHHLRLCR